MRKFRGILQTKTEPLDKEILWYWKGKLLYYDSNWEPFLDYDYEEIEVDIEGLPQLHNLRDVIDYLIRYIGNFIVVDTIEERDLIQNIFLRNGIRVWVNDANIMYIYDKASLSWLKNNTSISSANFIMFCPSTTVTSADILTRVITVKDPSVLDYMNMVSYNVSGTVEGCTNAITDSTAIGIVVKEGVLLPEVGDIIYNVGAISTVEKCTTNILVLHKDTDSIYPVLKEYINVADYPNNSYEFWGSSSFKIGAGDNEITTSRITSDNFIYPVSDSSINLGETAITHTNDINTINTLITEIKETDLVQRDDIDENTRQIQFTKEALESKVIEAGGVAWDDKPTEGSLNAVLSGRIYQYIEDKFVVISESDYENLRNKDPNVFYFVYEE